MEGLEGCLGRRLGWLGSRSIACPRWPCSSCSRSDWPLWPVQKNLATLISCTALVMVAAQFWMGWGGGLAIAWYLPLTLLTIFRPNLEDRIAVSVVKGRTAEPEPRPAAAA